jgi:hypothetical protein
MPQRNLARMASLVLRGYLFLCWRAPYGPCSVFFRARCLPWASCLTLVCVCLCLQGPLGEVMAPVPAAPYLAGKLHPLLLRMNEWEQRHARLYRVVKSTELLSGAASLGHRFCVRQYRGHMLQAAEDLLLWAAAKTVDDCLPVIGSSCLVQPKRRAPVLEPVSTAGGSGEPGPGQPHETGVCLYRPCCAERFAERGGGSPAQRPTFSLQRLPGPLPWNKVSLMARQLVLDRASW